MGSDGRPRGICHIEYTNKEHALSAIESSAQEPIHMSGRDLRVDYSAGAKGQAVVEPSEKLYFSGCAGDEAEIRGIFKQFSNSIVDIHLCMLFIFSDSLPVTHLV
jgi:RNA recognition motif-containing protein